MTHLLELHTLERPTITIDNVAYVIMRPEDFGLAEALRVQKLRQQVAEALGQGVDTETAVASLSQALITSMRLLLPETPDEVLARLSDSQRLAVFQAFTKLAAVGGKPTPAL